MFLLFYQEPSRVLYLLVPKMFLNTEEPGGGTIFWRWLKNFFITLKVTYNQISFLLFFLEPLTFNKR